MLSLGYLIICNDIHTQPDISIGTSYIFMRVLKLKIKLKNDLHKSFFQPSQGMGVTSHHCYLSPWIHYTTHHDGCPWIIGERGRDRLFFYGLVNQKFPEILKNICDKKLLKIGLTGFGKIKMRVGKGGTHSKGFPENIAKVFRALNISVKRSLERITIVS